MRRNQLLKCVATTGLLSVFLAGSFAMARDNDDKKDRSNQGGRSSSSSGNSGSSSSRSASSSSSSGQSRSSSSSDSSRGFSGRSSQTIQIPTSDRSTRSFGSSSGSGSGGPAFSGKSFSGSSSRSSDKNSASIGSSGSQMVARPIDGAITSRNTGNVGSPFQGSTRGNTSGGNSGNSSNSGNNSARTFSNGSNNTAPFNRLSDNSDNNARNGSKTGNQNRDGNYSNNTNNTNNDSNTVKRTVNGQNNQTGNAQVLPGNALGNGKSDNRFGRPQTNQNTNQTNVLGSGAKPTKEKVDDFLQLRRGNGTTSIGSGDRDGGGKGNRTGNFANDGSNTFKSGTYGSQKPVAEIKKDADQAWVKRFGKSDGTPGNNWRGTNDGKYGDGKNGRPTGIVNLPGNNSGNADRKFDKNFVDRNYQDWRTTASDNKRGHDVDHRDWSGQWKKGDRFVAADQIRDHWKSDHWKNGGKGYTKDLPFSKNWWNDHDHHDGHDHDGHDHHDGHWNHWDHFGDRHYHPYHWWNWCSAPRLTTFVSFGWNDPYYWDYGPGEYIYANNGIVYVNGTWFEPAPVFYRRTLVLAQQAPVWTPAQAAQIDWLPLGVFAIARDGVADNNVLVQLAVTRDGVIGGTLFNQLTGASFPIQGMVDKQTQRAAWTYTDDLGSQIVMESSIFNLTQPAATGLIHYSPDNIQVMELVRLEDPNAGQ